MLEGTASVTRDRSHVGHFGAGDFFGEVGIQGDGRRTATVVATSDMTLASMMGWSFRDMVDHYPAVARKIQEAIERRLG